MSTTRDPLSVRPVRRTDDLPAWDVVLQALGGVRLSGDDGEAVYQLGAGRLALRPADDAHPAGSTELCLETSVPLAEAVEAARAEGVPIELLEGEGGPLAVITADDGVQLTLEPLTPNPEELAASEPSLAVLPVWRTPAGRVALDVLDGLGLRRRVTLEDGTWADLTARTGGLHGVQPMSEVGTELAFELTGRVEALLEPLASAGVPAEVVEEETCRVLRVSDPDGGEPLRVVEREPDLYSYALSEM